MFLPPYAPRRPAPPSVAFLPPLAAIRRPSPPCYMSANTRPRGLDGVVAAQTHLSHVDGQAGELIIGGYQLKELATLRREVAGLRALPEAAMRVVRAAAKAPPIDALRMACATLSLDLPHPDDISPAADLHAAKLLTARFPTVVAAHARLSAGQEPIAPRTDLPLAANFLYMVHGKEPDPIAARAIDTYWVTVIDHGMNASTFAARVIASTRSDMVSAVTGAIGALKGPLHGGAPGPVLDMLKDIESADRAEQWVRAELAAGRRIMGFGHRVYKVRDLRADVLSKVANELGAAALENRKLFDLARAAEQTILRVLEEAKPGRNLRTNVEFYTALVLQALGLEPRSFVATFACGRVAGWCAHVIEQHAEDHLIRPQSEYVGPKGLKVD